MTFIIVNRPGEDAPTRVWECSDRWIIECASAEIRENLSAADAELVAEIVPTTEAP